MVQISRIIAILATGASLVEALPSRLPIKKRAQQAPHWKLVREGPSDGNSTSPTSVQVNWEAALIGAGMLGALGSIIGGLTGAFMPMNTTFSVESITAGLQSEFAQIGALMAGGALPGIPGGADLGALAGGLGGLGGLGALGGLPNPAASPPVASTPVASPSAASPSAASSPSLSPSASTPPKVTAMPPSSTSSATLTPTNPMQRGPSQSASMGSMSGMSGMGHGHGGRRT